MTDYLLVLIPLGSVGYLVVANVVRRWITRFLQQIHPHAGWTDFDRGMATFFGLTWPLSWIPLLMHCMLNRKRLG